MQKLKEQYGYKWKYESVREFSFPQGCEQVSIKLTDYTFQDEATIELLNDEKVSSQYIQPWHNECVHIRSNK